MRPVHRHPRAGMTLVELLVVVAILGLLAVTVLPNISNSADSRRTREATRVVSSFIAQAQARAIGRTEWAGFWLEPPNAASQFALDIFVADVPQAYRGETLDATVQVSGDNPVHRGLSYSSNAIDVARTGIADGDLIRFDGRGPWFQLGGNASLAFLRGSAYGENAGQSELNTAWPAQGSSVWHTFEVLRRPQKSGKPLTLTDGRCIDMVWSGTGPVSAADTSGSLSDYQRLAITPGVAVTIVFDASGRARQILRTSAAGTSRQPVATPIFLLVGRADRVPNDPATYLPQDDTTGVNWQRGDSFWIGIDPVSGIAKVAECRPGATNVVESQEFIRSELVAEGR